MIGWFTEAALNLTSGSILDAKCCRSIHIHLCIFWKIEKSNFINKAVHFNGINKHSRWVHSEKKQTDKPNNQIVNEIREVRNPFKKKKEKTHLVLLCCTLTNLNNLYYLEISLKGTFRLLHFLRDVRYCSGVVTLLNNISHLLFGSKKNKRNKGNN